MTISTQIEESARMEAARQWNKTACGELDGNKTLLEYFERVERERYRQQCWQHDYFHYERYGGQDVLELGVGQGTDLIQFAKAGARCHGADITDNHLMLTQRNFELRGKHVDLRKADGTALPFGDGSMDCVYSFGVIHHIPEAEAVLDEVYRVLRPGGRVMISLYYKWSAFHLVKWLLIRGVLMGDLFRLGYDGLLATIETGADGKRIKPYVKLYSKGDMAKLLRHFRVDDISVHQFSLDQMLPSAVCGRMRFRALPLEGLFGWYVSGLATKLVV